MIFEWIKPRNNQYGGVTTLYGVVRYFTHWRKKNGVVSQPKIEPPKGRDKLYDKDKGKK